MRSGVYGSCRVAAAIVGFADMTLGDRVAATLDANLAAAPHRFRGVRQIALAHPNPDVLRFLTHKPPPDLFKSPAFRAAMRELGPRGLSFDATVLHNQLPELGQVANEFPDTTVVLDHLGLALGDGPGPEGRAEAFKSWRANMQHLALNPNVYLQGRRPGNVLLEVRIQRTLRRDRLPGGSRCLEALRGDCHRSVWCPPLHDGKQLPERWALVRLRPALECVEVHREGLLAGREGSLVPRHRAEGIPHRPSLTGKRI